MKILVTPTSLMPNVDTPVMKKLRSFSQDLIFNPTAKPLVEHDLIALLGDCDGCIAGIDHFSANVINSAPKLKVISRYGVGIDNVDMEAARLRNVTVCNTPGANAHAVADLTIALLLCIARKIPMLDKAAKEGEWPRSIGIELYGKTIGILGLGAIGREVARRASGFSMRILAYDPFIDADYADSNGIIAADFNTVTGEADFLCLHMPLTVETRYVISADTMRNMKKGSVIVNTARGGLIDEAAAYELLKSGHLGGLGLDVFEQEPPQQSPLFELKNVVITPHTAGHTKEAIAAMTEISIQNLIDVLSGKDCRYIV